MGVAEEVVVLVCLAAELRRVAMVVVHRPEAPRPVGVQIELGLTGRHELGDRAAYPAGAAESIEGQTCGHVQAAHARHRAHERYGVGRHRIRMADELDDAGLVDEGKTSRRTRRHTLEWPL